VSILRVLSSYPNGLAKRVDVKRDLAFLATSGVDWAKYSKRLGAPFLSLDVFSSGMVQIYSFGWRLTAKGAIALEMMVEAARNLEISSEISRAPVAEALEVMQPSGAAPPMEAVVPVIDPMNRRARFTVIDGGRNEAA
jgi:hypothetical protein